ncbi:MAG: FAD-binding oxidoreductase [Bacteroidales bacterium]|nr:MAG: FAD-binding oxidoreductase [Bacteroidales bacterium]
MIKQEEPLNVLKNQLEGEFNWDRSTLIQYATDASAYREIPLAVALPKHKEDLDKLIVFSKKHKIPLVPRAAGTSLAGQVVGSGIIVDISRYWGRIIEINAEEHWVRVEPGVILDELNLALKPYGLFFGPETSTSNRCMIAGMVGNNSCGSHSILYGSTRDHTISIKMILDDGVEYEFGPLSNEEFFLKNQLEGKEGDIYRFIYAKLSDIELKEEIIRQYPEPSVKRRNTGYAIDMLLDNSVFGNDQYAFNFSKLIAGSEGTLGFITEVKLNLVPLPPKQKAVIAIHLSERNHAFKANLIALKYKPGAVEMMDNLILNCTKGNIEQKKNRFFVQGEPGAILIVEFARDSKEDIQRIASAMEAEMRLAGFGYHFPIIWGDDISKIWALRKAGLGVLSNMEGDAKPVSLVEDTAVAVEKLPDYMDEFAAIMVSHNLDCVYHAHIGSGELHLRPVLNLKENKDVELFRVIAFEVAHLVKKYKGSLSGEHGDGRLRGELIPIMLGERVYGLMQELKQVFDPDNIFNPGKIVNSPPLNSSLRYEPGRIEKEVSTIFDFSNVKGLLRAVEKCNGSGDCRKTVLTGGTMCPSYMASLNESNTTRARANILREFLTHSDKRNPFNHIEIYQVLDLCLSCKGCKNECPSSVDMAKLKAEFLQHWYDANGIPLRSRLVAYITKINAIGSIVPSITNFFLSNKLIAPILMKSLGFEPKRKMPLLSKTTLKGWYKKNRKNSKNLTSRVLLFPDEFTNYNDSHIGIKAVELLETLGYEVIIPDVSESGRTYISKGLVRTAKRIANHNIEILSKLVSDNCPLIGIEPSAILSFRDEYPDLSTNENLCYASYLSRNTMLFEEFFMREVEKGNISKDSFTSSKRILKLHGHCQQKAVASTTSTKEMLSFPEGHTINEIPSGCCGMAGSFGYEKEHYELSMKVGELVLFPDIRSTSDDVTIVAPGTSCRHQIKDGTGRRAYHPIEVMWEALKRA